MKFVLSLFAVFASSAWALHPIDSMEPGEFNLELIKFAVGEDTGIEASELDRDLLNGCLLRKFILGERPFDDDDDDDDDDEGKGKGKMGKGKRRLATPGKDDPERAMLSGCILEALGFTLDDRRLSEEKSDQVAEYVDQLDREVLNGCILRKLILGERPFDDDEDDDDDDEDDEGKGGKGGKGKRRRRLNSKPEGRELKFGCVLAALGLTFD